MACPTKVLNQAIKRNANKFPKDFMFQLTSQEANYNLRSQFVTSSSTYGGRRYLPYAFTEHRAIMTANALNSSRAVEMSVFVVRAFVKMRSLLSERKELLEELTKLEKKLTDRLDIHEIAIVNVLRQLMEMLNPPPTPPVPPKGPIGFHP
ncbi:MAG: ORF6N domain-containing protein [Candidatus Omnitrophota bacterium]